jgi:predicted MPP superfamily phosphohydrolase
MPGIIAALSSALERAGLVIGIIGAVCVAYGALVERRWYRRRVYRLELLRPEAAPVSLLHLSDLHFVEGDRRKARFLAAFPQPDVAVVTGDLLGEPEAVETVVRALRPLRGRLASYFVLGSNDYFAPRPLNYVNYFRRKRRRRLGIRGRSGDLIRLLESDGWVHLRNRRDTVSADGTRLEVLGLDDPHIERQDLRVAPRRDPDALGVAVVHSPDPAPELAALGYDLIVSGHTHGGQVRFPGVGALVTNSSIPTRLAMGLARLGPSLLHVSPGLGTSKFAPFRFLCRPEATILELLPHSVGTVTASSGEDASASSNARS